MIEMMELLDLGIKVGGTVITLILVYRFKNEIMELFRELCTRSGPAKMDLDELRANIDANIEKVILHD